MINSGDPLGKILATALREGGQGLRQGDVLAVCQKVVSKQEGRVVDLSRIAPSPRARAWASEYGKDPRVVEVVLREAKRIVRMEGGLIIAETQGGLVCANAGVDLSNAAGPDQAILLPSDPDASAARLREEISGITGQPVGLVITDTFGRPWREGVLDVAIGVSGLRPLLDLRGGRDWTDRPLDTTVVAIADQIAAAAGIVMGKADGTPAAIVRGVDEWLGEGTAAELIRPAERDFFR